ncbi:hypothetical protein [Streptomyces sp. NPDC048665]|uniref:hypothetical protein n=1 Tax=Streptomyces sp. NPDC048665 TaxID=3155490 RepID=UPI0034334E40
MDVTGCSARVTVKRIETLTVVDHPADVRRCPGTLQLFQLTRTAGATMQATRVRRREPPEVVIEYVSVDGPEGEQLAIKQGEAIRDVLAWLYTHPGCAERNREPDGSAESQPNPSGPSA